MRFQFTLRRLLLATVGFAVPLGCFAPFGSFGAVASALVVSCCVFAIILVARRSNGCRIFCTALFGLIGGCVATPAISNPGCGPAEAGAYGVGGIIVGWLIGCGVARLESVGSASDGITVEECATEFDHDVNLAGATK